MEFITINLVLICFATITTGGVPHNPRVKEDTSENLRVTRNPANLENPIFNPAPFTFQQTSQQNYLKQRYAEQQQVNMERLKGKADIQNLHKIYEQTNLEHSPSSEPYDWQPKLSGAKRRRERSSKEYIPLVVNPTSNRDAQDRIGSDNIQEREPMSGHIIYVDPRILRQVFELKNKQKQIQSRSISLEQIGDIDTNSLSELIGKNPHIQLGSLQRILQDSRQRNKIFPAIGSAQPFQQKDHTPIIEKSPDIPNPRTRPNIQVDPNHHHPIIPQGGQVISKETFERLQKQLDESSQHQVQDALQRAQKAAQAHVAAQHKAIEQAQKAILENVQKQLQEAPQTLRLLQERIPQYTKENDHKQSEEAPQALRLVQGSVPQYATHITQEENNQKQIQEAPQALRLVQPQYTTHLSTHQAVYPTPLPESLVSPVHDVTIPTSKIQFHTYKPTSLPDTAPLKGPSHVHVLNLVPTTQLPKQYYTQQNKQKPVPTRSMDHYAPNHLHQAVAHIQAEKVLLAQVHSQNNAILNGNRGLTRYVGQKVSNEEKEAEPPADAYQHIVFDPRGEGDYQNVRSKEKQQEEQDDLQYAAKYAFGYRIKDNKEGNDFGHEERRNGRSAEGSYQVLLPDGRRQKVEYYADDSGYHAKVTYENVAAHA